MSRRMLNRLWMGVIVFLTVLIFVCEGTIHSNFQTGTNLVYMFRSAVRCMILAVAIAIPISYRIWDFSQIGIACLAGTVFSWILTVKKMEVLPAEGIGILIAVVASMLMGCISIFMCRRKKERVFIVSGFAGVGISMICSLTTGNGIISTMPLMGTSKSIWMLWFFVVIISTAVISFLRREKNSTLVFAYAVSGILCFVYALFNITLMGAWTPMAVSYINTSRSVEILLILAMSGIGISFETKTRSAKDAFSGFFKVMLASFTVTSLSVAMMKNGITAQAVTLLEGILFLLFALANVVAFQYLKGTDE